MSFPLKILNDAVPVYDAGSDNVMPQNEELEAAWGRLVIEIARDWQPKEDFIFAYKHLTAIMDNVCAESPGAKVVACKKGCTYCCDLLVSATTLEAFVAVRTIHATVGSTVRKRIHESIKVNAARALAVGAENSEGYHRERITCSLLDGTFKTCRVYKTRPLYCRGFNSLDVKTCERGFETRDPAIRIHSDSVQMEMATYAQYATWLLYGPQGLKLDMERYEWHSALAAVWDDEGQARWLAGESVVDPAAKIGWLKDDNDADARNDQAYD